MLLDDHCYGGLDARAVESQYYHHPSHQESSDLLPSSGPTQYMAGIECARYYMSTPDMPHVPLSQGQNHGAITPHSMDAYHSFTPVLAMQGTHSVPEANVIDREYALDIPMNPALPTPDAHYLPVPEEQNQGDFPPSQDTDEPSSAALGTLPLHPENNNYAAGDDVAENEAPPSATEDLGHFDVSELVPPSMARMSISDMYEAAREEIDRDLLRICHISVVELAQVMYNLGSSPAKIFGWMVKRFYRIEGFKCPYPDCTYPTVYQSKGALMKHVGTHFFCYVCTNEKCNPTRKLTVLGSQFTFVRHMKLKPICKEVVSKAATTKYSHMETKTAVMMHCLRRIAQPYPWLNRDLF